MLPLPARLTHTEAQACLLALQQQAGQGGDLVVDASALDDFDSAALATLLALRRWAQAQGRGLRVQQVPARLAELVSLYGVAELLPS
ncbi:MAG: STAS domain-containing protein [Hylemonella sp.]|nr:STAS domain-containing protein [Hylemonella sp.]